MAHLPQQWINDGQARPENLVLVEIAEQFQRALARVDDGLGESGLGNREEIQAVTFCGCLEGICLAPHSWSGGCCLDHWARVALGDPCLEVAAYHWKVAYHD